MLTEQHNYVPDLEIIRYFFFNFVVLAIFITWKYKNVWSDKVC